MMNRYFVFIGDHFIIGESGMSNFLGDFNTLDAAIGAVNSYLNKQRDKLIEKEKIKREMLVELLNHSFSDITRYIYAHILDCKERKIVWRDGSFVNEKVRAGVPMSNRCSWQRYFVAARDDQYWTLYNEYYYDPENDWGACDECCDDADELPHLSHEIEELESKNCHTELDESERTELNRLKKLIVSIVDDMHDKCWEILFKNDKD